MPRKSINTERGSRVAHEKRARTAAWRSLLLSKFHSPLLSLRHLARASQLSRTQATKRWHAFEAARARGQSEEEALTLATSDERGGSNRALTREQEQILADIVRGAAPALSHVQLQSESLRFKHDCDVAAQHAHGSSRRLRSQLQQAHAPPFHASDHFITGFKRRQRLSSHRTAVAHVSHAHLGRDEELEKLAFVVEVREAVTRYGARMVLNMDETPVSLLDVPITAITATASKQPATVSTSVNTGTKMTIMPTISAAGDKLALCGVLKGKTARCLKKIREGASSEVNRVHLYYSDKGWINEGVMALYFRHVLLPYTHAEPAALILDSYRAHLTSNVREAAQAMQLQLIIVPGGCTKELQPLDVNFNGPLLMKRKQIWAQKKLSNPFADDTHQGAIERTQQAYASIDQHTVESAWRKAWLID
jgi:hypothetical protein